MIVTAALDVFLAAWVALAGATTWSVLRFRRLMHRPGPPLPTSCPAAVIIAPVKGAGPHLATFLARLREQDYAPARVVVIVEAEADPAFQTASDAARGAGHPLTVCVAGPCARGGQKVWNLTKGLATLGRVDEIVAFVDADTMPSVSWLRALAGPILAGRADCIGGYRWIVPARTSPAAHLVAAIDHAIATFPRYRRWNLAWGGSWAARRTFLDRIELLRWWQGAVSDDVQLTRALWAKKLKIVHPPGMLVATTVDHTVASAFEFTRRQYVIMRTHLPRFVWLSLLSVLLPMMPLVAALAAASMGRLLAWVVLAIIFGLSLTRAALRTRIEAAVLAEAGLARARTPVLAEAAAMLVAPLFNLAALAACFSSRRIRWAGVTYEIAAPEDVRVTRPS